METWCSRDQARYAQELKALEDTGIKFSIDEKANAQNTLRLLLTIDKGNANFPGLQQDIELSVAFPDSYPFFRPEVYGLNLHLPRHQNPFGKNLCLVPRATSFWKPEDTLVDFLKSQLISVVTQGKITSADELSQIADEQAEPYSEYYSTSGFVIFDTTPFENENVQRGKFELLGTFTFGIPDEDEIRRLVVLETFDNNGQKLNSFPPAFANLFKKATGTGIICRVNEAPPESAEEFQKWLLSKASRNILDKTRIASFGSTLIDHVIAINFPEEVEPGKNGSGWIFYAKTRTRSTNRTFKSYVKALRANKSNFNQRVPKLKPLSDKKIVLFGLGALGAPSAIEFARNGVEEIRIIDFDYIDPPTTIRWPLGMASAGLFKIDGIKKFIEENYPYTKVISETLKIGEVKLHANDFIEASQKDKPRESQILNELFEGASLIFDATAELGVGNYLSYLSKQKGIPFVSIEATEGVLGGQVMRVNPTSTKGCWMCLQYAQYLKEIPIAPKDNNGKLQATGCGDLSFTGTSFDLQNIYAAGVRLAISTLCGGVDDGYPALDWDVSILSLVDESGKSISPLWKDYKLEVHSQCPYCANQK